MANDPWAETSPNDASQRVTISVSSVLLLIAVIPLLVLLWQLKSLLLLVMISVVLACSIAPVVDWAEQYRVPRWLGVVLVYLTLISALVVLGLLIGPTVFEQLERLIRRVPVSLRGLLNEADAWLTAFTDTRSFTTNELFTQLIDVQSLISWTIKSSQQLLVRSYGVTAGILGGVLSLVLALFVSGYMVADSRTLVKNLTRLLPSPWDERLLAQAPPMGQRIGGYLRGRFMVSALLSIATTVGLSLLGLKDLAVGLGAIAGVTNLIPFLGPILGAVPALLVAIPQGGWTFWWVLLLYVVAQNLETYILDPLLVGSSVGVHPLYQLLAVLGGAQVLGIIGALIVPPWIAGGAVLLENLYLRPKLITERRQRRNGILTGLTSFQPDS
ncbi:AI-2E family transporter [Leptothoe spongobia]|uniref:AI-2E family transporter n=1 Tax=Leptothoe spongobia TAU-MAC 1115 TaxID=1967444 RepID=A0A947GJU5_9CYAN|nr:AI-2E family transporter [Leptothoe spongobia]MBT9316809.1 AI-2E family transporter [Leptothoe spongobia TAU-MAC 1115]